MGWGNKSRRKTHDISMRGPIRCGECGAMVTAEEKVKIQKNGNRHEYIYYHCTGRKNKNCLQKRIRIEEKELERQVMEIFSKIEIPQEFYEWAMDVLRESNEAESATRTKSPIVNGQNRSSVKMIDAIIDMRARGEITEEEFTRRKTSLLTEKHRLQGLINDADKGVDDWLATAEQVFQLRSEC